MTPEEMAKKLRDRQTENLPTDEIIELCFKIMTEHQNDIEKCRAAVILSGMVKKGLGKRTEEFLAKNKSLPMRVHEVLTSAIMRMESY